MAMRARFGMKHVLQAAEHGEPAVLHVLDEVGRYLGIGIASLINAFNPSLVVLGGSIESGRTVCFAARPAGSECARVNRRARRRERFACRPSSSMRA